MFINHREFEQIPDDTIIWRYMTFDKFKSLLENKSLFFTKVSHFHNDDPFEGRYNQLSRDYFINSRLLPGETLESIKNDKNNLILKNEEALNHLNSKLHEHIIVNCWQINELESVGMWKLYSNYESGIAIQTTYGKLKESFESNEKNIYGGKIGYIDHKKHIITHGNTFAPFMKKRLFFQDENELRLLIDISNESKTLNWSNEQFKNGRLIPCNINTLIESVFVSPKSTEGFRTQIQNTITESGILNIDVKKSEI